MHFLAAFYAKTVRGSWWAISIISQKRKSAKVRVHGHALLASSLLRQVYALGSSVDFDLLPSAAGASVRLAR